MKLHDAMLQGAISCMALLAIAWLVLGGGSCAPTHAALGADQAALADVSSLGELALRTAHGDRSGTKLDPRQPTPTLANVSATDSVALQLTQRIDPGLAATRWGVDAQRSQLARPPPFYGEARTHFIFVRPRGPPTRRPTSCDEESL
ncbi:hypothetical protein OAX78_02120 [Planctomycetota bacterium]|nr:hypothetical protein [Planctomycetota bacterium]